MSFAVAFGILGRERGRQLESLQGSVLLYNHEQPGAEELVRWVETLGIQPLDLLAPGAGRQVYQLTGRNRASSPTLLWGRGQEHRIVAGTSAVQQVLEPIATTNAPSLKGQQALVTMGALILVGVVFAGELAPLASLLPLLGMAAVTEMSSRCLLCGSGSSMLSAVAPIAGLLYFGAGALLFTIPATRNRVAYLGFAVVSAAIPSVQALMLTTEPKLCPACLAVTFASAVYGMAALKTLGSSRLTGIAAGRPARVAIAICFCILLTRHSLVLAGRLEPENGNSAPKEVKIPRIVGTPLASFVPDLKPQAGTLYVVTQPMCGACAQAKSSLDAANVAYHQLPVCNPLSGSECFNAQGQGFVTPMFLMSNSKGDIVFQENSWPQSPQEVRELQQQFREMREDLKKP